VEQLDLFDRATLRVWRLTNLVAWPMLAFMVGLLMRVAGDAAAGLLSHGIRPSTSIGSYVVLIAVPSSVLGGLAIGGLIGSRVYRWPLALSMLVSSVLIATIAWAGGLGTTAWSLATILPTVTIAPVSLFAARRSWRQRPAALRGFSAARRATSG
jgi:hypothetical protein